MKITKFKFWNLTPFCQVYLGNGQSKFVDILLQGFNIINSKKTRFATGR
jgi:hypothetical protein